MYKGFVLFAFFDFVRQNNKHGHVDFLKKQGIFLEIHVSNFLAFCIF